jgi:glycosyltransferase involved in cell wall biosynthesis
MGPSLRILQVAPLWYPVQPDMAGREQIVYLIARELLDRGHSVTLVATGDSAKLGRLVAVYPEAIISAMENGFVDEYPYYEAAQIADALSHANNVDLVHSHIDCQLVPFSHLFPVPVVHTIHNHISRDMAWLARRYPDTNFVTVGYHQAGALEGLPSVRTIPNGIELGAFPFSATSQGYLLFLGRLVPSKGPEIAIQVAKALRQPLIIAGPSGDRRFFEEAILPQVDGELVHYVGPVTGADKTNLLKNAAVLLFPTMIEEAFGLVMVEAMACGTPVVALRRGAVPEIVTTGVNGFYTEQLAELPELVRKASALDRVGVRHSVEHRFSHRRMVDEYLNLYQEVLEAELGKHKGKSCRGKRSPRRVSLSKTSSGQKTKRPYS